MSGDIEGHHVPLAKLGHQGPREIRPAPWMYTPFPSPSYTGSLRDVSQGSPRRLGAKAR